jgi:fatty acid desaturase
MTSSSQPIAPPEAGSSRTDPEPRVADQEAEEHTHWVSRAAFPLVAALLMASQIAAGWAVYSGWYWLAVPLVVLISHFMHGALIGFHEASHGLLRKSRLLNDIDGIIIGALSLMSFTLYRAAHQTHHMHLATAKDEELWPFVNVDSPRWARRLAAFVELNAGLLFSPFLFWRMFFRPGSFIRSRKVRRRIWIELVGMILAWTVILFTVHRFGVWPYFLWCFAVPAAIAANLQSWRKYVEHVGLHGHTARSATRSIIADTWSGRLLSLTLLHEPFHAVHHLRAGLHHYELPLHKGSLQPSDDGDVTPFPSYRSAIRHLMTELSDPRVGSHWPDDPPRPGASAGWAS